MTQLNRLESLGYRVTLGDDGKIRATLPGGLPPPPEAKELLAWCREHREEVKDELIFRSGKVKSQVKVAAWPLSVDDPRLQAWTSVFDKGLAELVSVKVHRTGGENWDIREIEKLYSLIVKGGECPDIPAMTMCMLSARTMWAGRSRKSGAKASIGAVR